MSRPKRPMDCRSMIWWTDDFLGSPFVQSAPPQIVGAYVLLINYSRKDGLDPDPDFLQTLTRLEDKDWNRWKFRLVKKFVLGEDGKLRHPKIVAQDVEQAEYRAGQSVFGKKGNETRWGTRSTPDTNPTPDSSATRSVPDENPNRVPVGLWSPPSPSPLRSSTTALDLPNATTRRVPNDEGPEPIASDPEPENEKSRLDQLLDSVSPDEREKLEAFASHIAPDSPDDPDALF